MTAGFVAVPTIVPLKVCSAGRRKNHVDTDTKIELKSETEGAVVYYTVNGKRPAPFEHRKSSHTLQYHTPFTLATGKVTIKAMAVSSDGNRESSVVTKTFFVEEPSQKEVDGEREEEEEQPSSSPVPPPLSLSAQLRHRISLEKTTPPTPPPSSPIRLPPTSITHSPERQNTTAARSVSAPIPVTSTAHPIRPSPSLHPASPIPPKYMCSHCHTPYSPKRGHQYCSHCGASLPSLPRRHTRPPSEMSVCSGCGVRVQPDIRHCPTCDSALVKPRTPSTIRGQTTSSLNEDATVLCSECGTSNITSHNSCITCDAPLYPSPASSPPSPPSSPTSQPPQSSTAPIVMQPISGQSYAMCGRCGRVNVSDSRFCDWCGSKPKRSQVSVVCCECTTAVDWHARHCTNCGAVIKAPHRSGVELDSTMKIPLGVQLGTEGWVPVVDIQVDKPAVRNQSSQTDRFYPSARTLRMRKEAEARQLSIQTAARDQVKKLNRFSPGNGLWRVQVDHVCSHLKAHALSSQDFQNNIGSPQMGKLVGSEVLTRDSVVDIKLQFSLKESEPGDIGSISEGSRPSIPRASLVRQAGGRTPTGQRTGDDKR